jgi:hypothetical protein
VWKYIRWALILIGIAFAALSIFYWRVTVFLAATFAYLAWHRFFGA